MEAQEKKYCLYARKSSEQDERQALSIESQLQEMQKIARDKGLRVVTIKKESHSAKDSGQRKAYNELIKELGDGKYNAILTWAPDRLSRNAGDLGSLVDLMDQGKLLEIHTSGQVFINDPNSKFLLMILCSQAKLENDNRAKNIVRGMQAKCQRGWRPCMAPLGYINERHYERGKSRVFVDPVRAPIIKEMFERVVNDGLSGRELRRWAVYEKGLRSRNDKKPALSKIYSILKNPFYYGEYEYPVGSGNVYQGKHEPLISKELFEQVRLRLLTNTKRTEKGRKQHTFSGAIKCGTCGYGIVATEKLKQLKDGSIKRYVYYHCSRNPDKPCNEPYVREEDLIKQAVNLLDLVGINRSAIKLRLTEDLNRFTEFTSGVLGSNKVINNAHVDVKKYVRYLLQKGTTDQKKDVMTLFDEQLIIKKGNLLMLDSE